MDKPTATVVQVVDPNAKMALFAIKTRKVGVGYYFGYGGKIEAWQTSKENACEEIKDETAGHIIVTLDELDLVGRITFHNGKEIIPYQCAPTFVVDFYRVIRDMAKVGLPPSTPEMKDPAWLPIHNLPWASFMPGDRFFLKPMLLGIPMRGRVHLSKDEKEVYSKYIVSCTREALILD